MPISARASAGSGAGVDLFCPAGRPFVDYASGRGISCHTWKTRGKLDPVTVVRLARLIRNSRANVIHTHLSTASLLGAFAARLAGVPSVAHVHGLNSATCFKYSTAVIAVSEAVKKHLCAQGLREDKVRVVHNGVDIAKFVPMPRDEARRELGMDTDGCSSSACSGGFRAKRGRDRSGGDGFACQNSSQHPNAHRR